MPWRIVSISDFCDLKRTRWHDTPTLCYCQVLFCFPNPALHRCGKCSRISRKVWGETGSSEAQYELSAPGLLSLGSSGDCCCGSVSARGRQEKVSLAVWWGGVSTAWAIGWRMPTSCSVLILVAEHLLSSEEPFRDNKWTRRLCWCVEIAAETTHTQHRIQAGALESSETAWQSETGQEAGLWAPLVWGPLGVEWQAGVAVTPAAAGTTLPPRRGCVTKLSSLSSCTRIS